MKRSDKEKVEIKEKRTKTEIDVIKEMELIEERLTQLEYTIEIIELQLNRQVQLLFAIRTELEQHLSKKLYEEEMICSDSFVQPEYHYQFQQPSEKRTIFSPVVYPMAPSFRPVNIFQESSEEKNSKSSKSTRNEAQRDDVSLPPIS